MSREVNRNPGQSFVCSRRSGLQLVQPICVHLPVPLGSSMDSILPVRIAKTPFCRSGMCYVRCLAWVGYVHENATQQSNPRSMAGTPFNEFYSGRDWARKTGALGTRLKQLLQVCFISSKIKDPSCMVPSFSTSKAAYRTGLSSSEIDPS